MFNLNKEIARHICLAQTASDAGKGLNILSLEGDKRAKLWGYSLKDKEIIKAISLINSSKITECQLRYYVAEMPDQNGNKSRVVYFYNTQEKIQISFHTFCGEIKNHKNKGVPMQWDKRNPRENCQKLIEIFNL